MSFGLDQWIGAELAGYRLESALGRGGVGVVYLAEDTRSKRKVAVKLVSPELAADPRFRERFLRESELAVSLDHPGIVAIYEVGESGGLLFLAMRYVEGTDLASLLAREGRLEPERALVIVRQLAEALDAARFSRGLVHGGLRASEVLIDSDGQVQLLGFGLSREAFRPVGAAGYLAPEQVEGEPATPRTDVYALGCLLCECLTGNPSPGEGSGAAQSLPVGIDRVVHKATASLPEERYSTCAELAASARAALAPGGEQVEDERPSPVVVSSRPERELPEELPPSQAGDRGLVASPGLAAVRPRMGRGRSIAAIGLVVLLAALVAGGLWLSGRDPGDARSAPVGSPADESAARAAEGPAEPPAEPAFVPPADAAGEASSEPLAWDEPGSIVRIDATTGETLAQIAIPSPFTIAAALVSDGESVWALGGGDSGMLLVRVEAATGAVTDVFDAGSYPVGGPPGFAAIRGSAWVDDGQLYRFSPGARTPEPVELDIDGPSLGYPVAAAGSLWGVVDSPLTSASPGDLVRVDPDTGKVLARIEGAGLVVAAGKGFLWAFRGESDPPRLVRIDTRTHETTPVGALPGGLQAYAFSDGAVWAASDTGTLRRLDPVTGEDIEAIRLWTTPAGALVERANPVSIAAGAGAIWAANGLDRTVARFEIATGEITTIPVHGTPDDVVFAKGSIWVTLVPPEDQVPPLPADWDLLGTGRNVLVVDGVPFSFTAPTYGWERFGNISINKSTEGPQDAEAIIFWTSFPDGDHADPCANLLVGQVGESIGDLASAVARAPGTELVARPSDVTLGGHPAKHVVLTVRKQNLGCHPGFFFTWDDVALGALWPRTSPGDTINVWIVRVDGKRLFIEAETHPQAGPDLEQEVEQIITSIRFNNRLTTAE